LEEHDRRGPRRAIRRGRITDRVPSGRVEPAFRAEEDVIGTVLENDGGRVGIGEAVVKGVDDREESAVGAGRCGSGVHRGVAARG